jgi:hypothetical protein
MSAVDLTLLLKGFRSPVVTTSEVAALMRGRVDSANKMLGRLTTKGVVKPLARGESLTLSNDLFADLVPGTGGVALTATSLSCPR